MNNKYMILGIQILCFYHILLNYFCEAEKTCHSKLGSFSPAKFSYFSCAWCYEFLFGTKPLKILFASERFHHLLNVIEKTLILPDIHNQSNVNDVCNTLDSDECTRWQSCCLAAETCCEKQLSNTHGDVNNTCGMTWDGWGCWEDAVPGEVVYQSCPLFLAFSVPSRDAVKTCLPNASWERKDGSEWTDYQPCLNFDDLKISLRLGLACSVASIALLFPAIIIFIRYKALRKQHRIRLHINFFLSLLLKEITVALWDMLVTYERLTNNESTKSVLAQNGPGCKVLSFLKIYSGSASYTWMFCEGFYLHRLISDAFSPPRTLIPLYVTGWVVPFVATIIYSILRLVYANESCWTISYNNFEWIFYAPNLACLLVNFIFLCNILRILLTQMQSHPNEPSHFRRAVKATFVLLPLFGVQFCVTIYRVPPSAPGGHEYERFSIVINNLQGFCVALIFCFLNHEVIANLRRTWRRRVRDRNSSHSRRADFTSMNVTYTSRSDTDFNYVNKPLFDKTIPNGDRRVNIAENINPPLTARPNVASDLSF